MSKKKFKKFRLKAKISQQLQEIEKESKVDKAPKTVHKTEEKSPQNLAFQEKEVPTEDKHLKNDLKKVALFSLIAFGLIATIAVINIKTNWILSSSQFITKTLSLQ